VATASASAQETDLLLGLSRGDEDAFAALLDRYAGPLRRVVRAYVSSDALAEEVLQETWLAVLTGLERFERRAALRTWIFRIAINRAKSKAVGEARSIPFSSLPGAGDDAEGAVDPDRFQDASGRWPDHWAAAPRPWEDPERRLLSLEGRDLLRGAIGALPPSQRVVVCLRDVEGLSAAEVCELLAISEVNQRVLLHRGRTRVRLHLETYLAS